MGITNFAEASEVASDKQHVARDGFPDTLGAEPAGGGSLGDRVAAVLILLALSPILLMLAAVVATTIGRPVLYRGERLGKDRAAFMVYKFRTLPKGIQGRLGTQLFSEQEEILPVLARFMRDTRLDELPQLFNVVRGEMRFFGPRPERREVYERYGRGHPDYELRFQTAPGLFGVSQLLTPHSSPKRLRARLDRRYLASGKRVGARFTVYAALALFRQLAVAGTRYLWQNAVLLKFIRSKQEKRRQLRVVHDQATIQLIDPARTPHLIIGRIVDMNREYIRARFDGPLPWSFVTTHNSRVSIRRGRGARSRTKTARCHAHVERQLSNAHGQPIEYLIAYSADTALNRYIVDQYFLDQAIVPRR